MRVVGKRRVVQRILKADASLPPCPFCGEATLRFRLSSDPCRSTHVLGIVCETCGAVGPHNKDLTAAEYLRTFMEVQRLDGIECPWCRSPIKIQIVLRNVHLTCGLCHSAPPFLVRKHHVGTVAGAMRAFSQRALPHSK